MADGSCTAFQGVTRIASGPLAEVAAKVKAVIDSGEPSTILIFDDVTAEPVEVDFRGSLEDVIARLSERSESVPAAPPEQRGPGRPKLGVVAREVTLLPRHWEWLARQPGGASVALRKLVEEARRANGEKDRRREAQAAAYRFMSAACRQRAGLRGGGEGVVCRARSAIRRGHCCMAPRHSRPCQEARRRERLPSQPAGAASGPRR